MNYFDKEFKWAKTWTEVATPLPSLAMMMLLAAESIEAASAMTAPKK